MAQLGAEGRGEPEAVGTLRLADKVAGEVRPEVEAVLLEGLEVTLEEALEAHGEEAEECLDTNHVRVDISALTRDNILSHCLPTVASELSFYDSCSHEDFMSVGAVGVSLAY